MEYIKPLQKRVLLCVCVCSQMVVHTGVFKPRSALADCSLSGFYETLLNKVIMLLLVFGWDFQPSECHGTLK